MMKKNKKKVGTVGGKSALVGIRKVLVRKNVDIDLMEEVIFI